MKYLLVTSNGSKMIFTVKSCADLYQSLYGGCVLSQVIA